MAALFHRVALQPRKPQFAGIAVVHCGRGTHGNVYDGVAALHVANLAIAAEFAHNGDLVFGRNDDSKVGEPAALSEPARWKVT
jgi:hypothetical protein